MKQRAKTVALIGGIGSGKSTVCDMLSSLGAGIVKLDEIGHDVLAYSEVKTSLRKAFGDTIFDDEGNVVRSRLAAAAFDSAEHTQQLNSITHPAIMGECFRRIDALREGHDVVVVEVTSGEMTREAFAWADVIVAVNVPEEVRLVRACARGGQSEADIRARMAQQPSDEQRASIADYTIDNDGSVEQACRAVEAVWGALVR